ncbi:MAG: hypothetical protein V1773_18000 [bacterium]
MLKNKKTKGGFFRLNEIVGTKKWWLFGSMIIAVAASIAQFVPYIAIYKILIELALYASNPKLINKDVIWYWGYISFFSVCIYGVLLYVSNMLSHIAAFNILYNMRVLITLKLVKLPLGFFSKNPRAK